MRCLVRRGAACRIRIRDAERSKDRDFARLHPGRLVGAAMVVTLKVKHAVDHEMGAVRRERLPLRIRFLSQQGKAEHHIAVHDAGPIIVDERQNVGRTALVSITAVERLAFRGVDKAQCHDGIIRQCGGGPASKKIP